ncbi:mitochondrial import inner membrane translocase subunit Tim54 [Emericellopsis atlantica]|uniref:Mitochondrial import inner membrane translocase subunit TIM54 n=1 Tax=Emericellopsis atlantica TaxID=2614577 RepID=A0A9P7ZP72_9HYPO|nr:mitochondrial import inner membrane translocase subunit Tim54 [Emericellopsis atlantica]KAG9255138.1 mitochondrial import inner membrane translocase subunit Tim54 [Emericellopsis atlantica]
MAETQPTPAQPAAPAAAPTPPPKPQNPALRMMGLPNLPRKLPSRNWMIFWGITGAFASFIIYDKREKKRATAKWRRLVAPMANEPIGAANQLPRKLTIYLEAPPGDSLRTAQDHFIEYAKPVLAASGLDWEFVQGRQQGDVRAAVAEKIRRLRRKTEQPTEDVPPTEEDNLEALRKRMNLPEYQGVKGDIVMGRHTWKEYVRGLHEGWLGSLQAPPQPIVEPKSQTGEDGEKKEAPAEEEKKPDRPPQPLPHNKPEDYALASLPPTIPEEFAPSAPLPHPHRLGFRHTFVRLGRFLNRRKLADDIGRDVAAVCFATSRDWKPQEGDETEQQLVLKSGERDWPKFVWQDEPSKDEEENSTPKPPKEKIWASPLTVDPRITSRMRRFEITPELEARAAQIKVPEEEIEGWIKGSLRSVWRWGASSFESKPKGPNVGNLDD